MQYLLQSMDASIDHMNSLTSSSHARTLQIQQAMGEVGASGEVFQLEELQLPDLLEGPVEHLLLEGPLGHQGLGHRPSGGMLPTLPFLVSGRVGPVTSVPSQTPGPITREAGGDLALCTQRCLSETSVGIAPMMGITDRNIPGTNLYHSTDLPEESPCGNSLLRPVGFPLTENQVGTPDSSFGLPLPEYFLLNHHMRTDWGDEGHLWPSAVRRGQLSATLGLGWDWVHLRGSGCHRTSLTRNHR